MVHNGAFFFKLTQTLVANEQNLLVRQLYNVKRQMQLNQINLTILVVTRLCIGHIYLRDHFSHLIKSNKSKYIKITLKQKQ